MDRMDEIAAAGVMDACLRRHDGYLVPETRRLTRGEFRGRWSAGRAQAMTTADAGTQTDVAMGCLRDFDDAGDGFAGGDQVSKRLSAPRPGVLRCFFALIVRAHGTAGCGGPGGRTTALGNAIRDSLP